jgi:hypothetical protein
VFWASRGLRAATLATLAFAASLSLAAPSAAWTRGHPRLGIYALGETLSRANERVPSYFGGPPEPADGEMFVWTERVTDALRHRVTRWYIGDFSLGSVPCSGIQTEEDLSVYRGGESLSLVTRFGAFAFGGKAIVSAGPNQSQLRYTAFRGRFLSGTAAKGSYEIKGCGRHPFYAVWFRR